MTSVAPSRFQTILHDDGTESSMYWESTEWVPQSAPGLWVYGDQTVLSSKGAIVFIDCHVLPGSQVVYPFGEWKLTDPILHSLVVDQHSAQGVHSGPVLLRETSDGLYIFSVVEGTYRVVSCPVSE